MMKNYFAPLSVLIPCLMVGAQSGSGDRGIGIAVFVTGDVVYVPASNPKTSTGMPNELKVAPRTTFQEKDIIITRKGKTNIQMAGNAVVSLSPFSRIEITTMRESGGKNTTEVSLSQGRIYSKVAKKPESGSTYTVKSPTVVAGVRGTEFMVSESQGTPENIKYEDSEVKDGVYVNEGSVALNASGSPDQKETVVGANQQASVGADGVKTQIMDDYMKKKMAIFAKLDVMKEKNYNAIKSQVEKDRANMDKILNKNKSMLDKKM